MRDFLKFVWKLALLIGLVAVSAVVGTGIGVNMGGGKENPAGSGLGGLFGMLIGAATPIVIVTIRTIFRRRRDRDRAARTQAAIAHVNEIVRKHAKTLARQYLTKVKVDVYGTKDLTPWIAEEDHFISRVLARELSSEEIALLHRPAEGLELADAFSDAFWEIAYPEVVALESGAASIENITPAEYERLCARLLDEVGWETSVTGASGDQGADVIATLGGETLVVQCKLYKRPVGNKAVQEAAAARIHYRATHAVVVAPLGFTPAARDLAASTGVLLLHHDDLPQIADHV